MKCQVRQIVTQSLCLLFFAPMIFCQDSEFQLQNLQQKIGNDLLKIKKEFPNSQDLVYSLLDQFSKYNNLSKNAAEKNTEYEKMLCTEKIKSENLMTEVASLKAKLEEFKSSVVEASKKLQQDFVKIKDDFNKERETFLKEKQQFETEKQAFLTAKEALIKDKEQILNEKELNITQKAEELLRKQQGTSEVKNVLPSKAKKLLAKQLQQS